MSLYARIAAVLCAIVVFTAAVSAGLIFWRFDTQLVTAKLDDLQRETQIQATHFKDQTNELIRDVRVVAGTSPVQGIIRAIGHGGIDPASGSTLAQWEHRLAVNFRETLRHKPSYMQMRFIGVANNGREVVRVDRSGPNGAIRIVTGAQLQPKAENAYFSKTLARDPRSVYLSPINLNREHGRIQTPHTPVIRAAVPVRNAAGDLFGIVIINYSLTRLFTALTTVPNPGHRYYLTNAKGQYLLDPDSSRAFDFELGTPHLATGDYPLLAQVLNTPRQQASKAVPARQQVVSVRRVDYGPADLKRHLGIIVTDNYADITSISNTVIQQIGLTIAALLILGLLTALWLARVTTRPIMQLTGSVRDMYDADTPWQRPNGLTTEAGELATTLESAFDSLKQRGAELDKSNRELQQFAYIASHDLQEPVRTISSFSKLLDSEYGDKLDARAKKYIHFLVESCERMQALIHGLLEYSRLGQDSVPQRVDLNQTLADIQQDMHTTIQTSGARISVATLPSLQLYAVEVRVLFQNLISNAIKYVPDGRAPVIDIACERAGKAWQFSVSDNGLGIAPEHRDKVFMIFQRLHGRSSAYAGAGIGLAHCKKVVELHHGKIWIEASASGGTRLCFTLMEVLADG